MWYNAAMETEKEAERLLRMFETLKARRKNFEPLWKECERNVAAVLQDWDDEKPDSPYKIPKLDP
jgi:hypothetical protein